MRSPRSGSPKKSSRFRCPHCGTSLEKTDLERMLDRSVDCPQCHGLIRRAAILDGDYDETTWIPEIVKYVFFFALGVLVIWALAHR